MYSDKNETIGRTIWKLVDNVVILEHSMRHAQDRLYGALLERVRLGTITDDDVNVLNTRVNWNISDPFATLGIYFNVFPLYINLFSIEANMLIALPVRNDVSKVNRTSLLQLNSPVVHIYAHHSPFHSDGRV